MWPIFPDEKKKKKLKCKLVSKKKKKLKCKLNIAWSTKVPLESSYFSHPQPHSDVYFGYYTGRKMLFSKKKLTHNQTF